MYRFSPTLFLVCLFRPPPYYRRTENIARRWEKKRDQKQERARKNENEMRRNEKTDERTNAGREERSKQKQATKHASMKNEKQSWTF